MQTPIVVLFYLISHFQLAPPQAVSPSFQIVEADGVNLHVNVWHVPNSIGMFFYPDPINEAVLKHIREEGLFSYIVVRDESEGLAYVDPHKNARRLTALAQWVQQETPEGVPLIFSPFVNGEFKNKEFLKALMPKLYAIIPWSAGTNNSINEDIVQWASENGIHVWRIVSPLHATGGEYAAMIAADKVYHFSKGKVFPLLDGSAPPPQGWVSVSNLIFEPIDLVPFEITYAISSLRKPDQIQEKVKNPFWGQAPTGSVLGVPGEGTIGQEVEPGIGDFTRTGSRIGLVGMGKVNRKLLETLILYKPIEVLWYARPTDTLDEPNLERRLQELRGIMKEISPQIEIKVRKVESPDDFKESDFLFVDPGIQEPEFHSLVSQLPDSWASKKNRIIYPPHLFVPEGQNLENPFAGRTLGVVGLGRLGYEVMLRFIPFGMIPIAYQRGAGEEGFGEKSYPKKKELIDRLGQLFSENLPGDGLIYYWDKEEGETEKKKGFLEKAHVAVTTVPLKETDGKTRGWWDRQALEWFANGKDFAMYINIARGPVVDQLPNEIGVEDETWMLEYLQLYKGLELALDVLGKEDYPTEQMRKFLAHPRVSYWLHHLSNTAPTRALMQAKQYLAAKRLRNGESPDETKEFKQNFTPWPMERKPNPSILQTSL